MLGATSGRHCTIVMQMFYVGWGIVYCTITSLIGQTTSGPIYFLEHDPISGVGSARLYSDQICDLID